MSGTNIWKDIKGYEGKYQVSYEGEIRKIYLNSKPRILIPYTKKNGRNRLFIRLSKDGKRKEFMVHQLVAQAFLREAKEGEVPYHKNGLIRDNWASNLEYINREKLGKMTGSQSRRKGVKWNSKY